jgi:hypothetical protein
MSWLHYLLEANIYLAVFYLLYFILLDKETHYKLNRIYLLSACIIAYIIPVVQIGILKPADDGGQVVTFIRNGALRPRAPENLSSFTLQNDLLLAYAIGAGAMLIMFFFKIFQLVKLTRAQKDLLADRYKLIRLENSNTAFSFFNYLFVGTKVSGADTIIRHELVHINQKHSFDIVFLELIKIISWFNPFIYLLQRSLKTVHEYIADEQTAGFENDTLTYSSFLVSNAYGVSGSSITHSFFNYNLLKKRIIMLNQKRSGNLARLKYLAALPVCAGLLCASTLGFSKTYGLIDIAPQKVTDTTKMLKFKELNILKTAKIKSEIADARQNAVAQQKFKQIQPPPPSALPKSFKSDTVVKMTNLKLSTSQSVTLKETGADKAVKVTNVKLSASQKLVLKASASDKAVKVTNIKLLPPPPPADPLDSFYRYIARHVRYPKSAHDERIGGTVIFEFNVVDGKMDNLKIVRALNSDLDAEALRVLRTYPGVIQTSNGTYDIRVTFQVWDKNNKIVSAHTNQKSNGSNKSDSAPGNNTSVRMLNEVVVTTYVQ